MSDLTMNIHTCVTINTTYTMLSDLMMNAYTCFTDEIIYTMKYVRALCLN